MARSTRKSEGVNTRHNGNGDTRGSGKRRRTEEAEISSDDEPLQHSYSEVKYKSGAIYTLQEALRHATAALDMRHEGDNLNAAKAMQDATRLIATSTGTLEAARRSWYPYTSVYLSDDVLHHIFSCLCTRDLLACSIVSRQWRAVLSSRSSLWTRSVQLDGSIRDMTQQWRMVRRHLGNSHPVVCLSVTHLKVPSQNMYRSVLQLGNHWRDHFTNIFPFDEVRHIHYEGHHSAIDAAFWKAMGRCCSLTHLDFTCKDYVSGHSSYAFHCTAFSKDDPITRCKSHEVAIDVDMGVGFNWLDLSQVKKFHIKTIMEANTVRRYLKEAASSLKDLHYCDIDHPEDRTDDSRWDDHDPDIHATPPERSITYDDEEPIVMPKLIKFEAVSRRGRKANCQEEDEVDLEGITRVNYHLEAPKLEEMTYRGFLGWDAILFASCRETLKQVWFEIYDHNVTAMLGAIKQIPSCETLTLKLSCSIPLLTDVKHPWMESGRHVGTAVSALLPKLSSLTLINDGIASGSGLVRFVEEKKSSSGQDLLFLNLQGCSSITRKDQEKLKVIVPHFHYSASEESR